MRHNLAKLIAMVVLGSGLLAGSAAGGDNDALLEKGRIIVLHKDLKVTGSLTTYSCKEAIQYCMGPVESCSSSDKQMIRPFFNPFILMLHLGYCTHRPISISPDAIWLLICHGFSVHTDIAGEELQNKLFPGRVRHGKTLIRVRRDDFVRGANNPWEGVFDEFTAQMGKLMANDVKAVLTAPFSTTGKAEAAAFNVMFMKAMGRSFVYQVDSFCGIPSIRLEGTPEDWDAVKTRAEKLRGYGCDWWIDRLKPILAEFSKASRGTINQKFWCSIYKKHLTCPGEAVSGWALNLFPYVREFGTANGKPRYRWGRTKPDVPQDPTSFPSTLAWVPFLWNFQDTGTCYKMAFQAGFVGVSLDEKTQTLRAEIGWSVIEDRKKRRPPTRNAAVDMNKDWH